MPWNLTIKITNQAHASHVVIFEINCNWKNSPQIGCYERRFALFYNASQRFYHLLVCFEAPQAPQEQMNSLASLRLSIVICTLILLLLCASLWEWHPACRILSKINYFLQVIEIFTREQPAPRVKDLLEAPSSFLTSLLEV